MALTRAFYEAVNTKNIRRIRMMMKDSLLVDLTFKEFYDMEKEISQMEGVYDEHDGRELMMDKSCWTDDYMDKIMVQVVSNFSHERIEHLKEVVRYLRPIDTVIKPESVQTINRAQKNESTSSSYQEQKHYDQQSGAYRGAKIGVGVVVGAIAGGTIAYATGITVVGGAIAGGVVGGVAMAVITNGGK